MSLTFGAIPSIEPIDIVSPLRLGAVELSPHYALLLNAEPLISHIDDNQLSVGYRKVEPTRTDLRLSVNRAEDHRYTQRQVSLILATYYSYFWFVTYISVVA